MAENTWSRLTTEGEPPQTPNTAMMAAVGPGDGVLVACEGRGKTPDQTWACRIDPVRALRLDSATFKRVEPTEPR